MSHKPNDATRRTIIAAAAATAAGLPILIAAKKADAAGTTPQSAVNYQNHPKGKNHCGICNYFLPGNTPTALGHCKVVAGQISPNGWCQLFAAKPA